MKVCIWGNVASSLEGNTAGGGELQIDLLSRVLAKAGHEVVIIDPFSNKEFATDEGIKVITVKNWYKGIKFLRLFTHQLPGLYRALKDQKADIYYSQIRDFRHYLSLLAARSVGGKFVVQLASDLDCSSIGLRFKHDYFTHFEGIYWFIRLFLNELLFPIVIRKADLVLVQHEGQEATLRNKGIASEIFNNLLDHNRMPNESSNDKTDFCYIGALDRRKGLIDFYQLAARNRDLTFKVIGAPRDPTGFFYHRKLRKLKNVKLFGKLGHNEAMHEILNSKGLVSTSPMEGFPNVFIEAWYYGLPVFSLKFDPGDVILRENLGVITNGNLKKLASALASFKTTEEFSSRVKQYIAKHHLINELKTKEVTSLFERIFKSTKGNKSKPRFLSFFAILLFFQKVILHKMLVYENFVC